MLKSNYFIKFAALIFFGFLISFFLHAFEDVKKEGFFSIVQSHKNVVKSVGKENYIAEFVARENNLGQIKIFYTTDNEGELVDWSFFLRQKDDTQWHNKTDFRYKMYSSPEPFPIGFPIIPDSKNKIYEIKFEDIHGNLSTTLLTKYTYSRSELMSDPKNLILFLFNRFISERIILKSITSMSFLFITVGVLVYAFLRNSLLNKIIASDKLLFGLAISTLIGSLMMVVVNFRLAEKFAIATYFIFFLAILKSIIWPFIARHLPKIEKFVESHIKFVTFLIAILIAAYAIGNPYYFLGGDETRLFYIYPGEFYQNFTSKIVGEVAISGVVNFLPPPSISFFTILLVVLNKILWFVNLQSLLFILNIVGGVFFFYKLVDYLFPQSKKYFTIAKMLSSLTYVFSIFMFYTFFNSQLIAMYSLTVFPLAIWLFLKSVNEKRLDLLGLIAIIFSFAATFAVSVPWFGGMVITSLPIILWGIGKNYKRAFVYVVVLGIFLVVTNLHWLVYVANSSVLNKSSALVQDSLSSETFRQKNEEGVINTASINNIYYPLLNSFHYKVQRNFNWPYLPIYNSWYIYLLPFNLFFPLLIYSAGKKLKNNMPYSKAYVIAAISWLMALYFYTVNFTKLGINFFVFLSNTVPGFVMFRNMFDKFAASVAFSTALILLVSVFVVFTTTTSERTKKFILYFWAFLLLLNAKPFFMREFTSLPIWTTTYSHYGVKSLNSDYLKLVEKVRNLSGEGKVLWLPLSRGNNAIIPDNENPNSYYIGVSPMLILSGKNDYSGLLSFGDFGDTVYSNLKDEKYHEVVKLFQKLNVEYIVIDEGVNQDIINSYNYAPDIFTIQNADFKNELLGEKIDSYGRYSLYRINPEYANSKLVITSSLTNFEKIGNIEFRKKSQAEYEITIPKIKTGEYMVFLDTYSDGWVLKADNSQIERVSDRAYGYANAWRFKTDGQDLKFTLYYQPYDYYLPSLIVSCASSFTLLVYSFYVLYMRKSKKNV